MAEDPAHNSFIRLPAWAQRLLDRWQADVRRVERGDVADMARGWQILVRTVATIQFTLSHFQSKRMPRQTAGLAYATALSLVPVLVLFVSIVNGLGLLDDAGDALVDGLVSNLFPVDRETASEQMQAFVDNAASAYAGGVGFLVTLVTSVVLFEGIERVLNDVWRVTTRRPFGQRLLIFWLFVTITPPLVTLGLIASGSVQILLQTQVVGGDRVAWLVPSLFPIVLTSVGLYVMYKTLPNRRVRWWAAAIGAVTTAVLFELGKLGFGFYVGQVVRATWFRVYGALFMLPVVLVWIQVSWLLVALGAQLAWVVQHLDALLTERAEQRRPKPSPVSPSDALAVANALVRALADGRGALRTADVAAETRLDDAAAGVALEQMADAGLVQRATDAEGQGIWPLRGRPDALTADAVLIACEAVPRTDTPAASAIRAAALAEASAWPIDALGDEGARGGDSAGADEPESPSP